MIVRPKIGIYALCLAGLAQFVACPAVAQTPPPAPPPPAPSPPAASQAAPQAAPPAEPQAQPTAAAPAPVDSAAPKIQLASQAPPPPPPVARTDKTHDGFYARLNLGFGSQSTKIDNGTSLDNFSGSGGTLDVGLLIGGAPSPGIVIGGALLLESLPSTTFDSGPLYSLKTSVGLGTLGPFIDGYPNPRGGFHLGGTLGATSVRLANDPSLPGNKAFGFGLAAWLGYDWWVADQWSLGGLLQFAGNRTTHHEQGLDMSVDTRTIALLLTAVYQ
jgi:hypothetical protein